MITLEILHMSNVISPPPLPFLNQVKQPVTHHFKPLKEALLHPGDFLLADWAKMDRAGVLHLGFQALHEYAHHKVRAGP